MSGSRTPIQKRYISKSVDVYVGSPKSAPQDSPLDADEYEFAAKQMEMFLYMRAKNQKKMTNATNQKPDQANPFHQSISRARSKSVADFRSSHSDVPSAFFNRTNSVGEDLSEVGLASRGSITTATTLSVDSVCFSSPGCSRNKPSQ